MADTLTYEQRLAVENRGGKLLVSAAAGSGKTKVLVDRLISYILDPVEPANIDDFLIITYTKAAAAELRGKIASKISELIAEAPNNRHLQQQMQRLYLAKISTVHAFCADILRQYAYRLDISADFRVADEGESQRLQQKALESVMNSAYETASDNPFFCAFIDTQGLGRDDRQIPEIIQKVYNSAMCHLNPEQWLERCGSFGQTDNTDASETLCGRYLMEDLRNYLNFQINSLERCVSSARKIDGMDKPIALFESTLAQLRVLSECNTWDEIVRAKEIEYGRLVFSKKCGETQLADQMKAVRKACKDGLTKKLRAFKDDSKQISKDIMSVSQAVKGLIWLVKEFISAYSRLKKSYGILDFGDLEHKTLDLLLGKNRGSTTSVAIEIGERFREVMVDEYQDSNAIQDAIFSALTVKRQNCFMVGDVKQSIYQFRLADPGIFIEKYNTYSPVESASDGEGRKVLLSKNFRSSNGIIQCVNDVFSQCMSSDVGGLDYGPDEILREGIAHISLNDPEITLYTIDVRQDTYAEEASFVSGEIYSLLDGKHYIRGENGLRPIKPEDIVILLRSPGSVGNVYLNSIQARGIRCTMGDAVDLLQTEEVATVKSILQIINNPLQDIPMVSVLTSPVFGFGAEDLAQLRSNDRYSDIYTLISTSQSRKCLEFMKQLNCFRRDSRLLTVTELLAEIYTKTDLLSIYSAMPDGSCRLDNLQAFFQIVSDFETTGPKDLGRFLEYLDSCTDRGLSASGAQQESDSVTIMSIHKSKGLEFPVVFLCGLSRSFNQESVRGQVLCDKDLGLGLSCVDPSLRIRFPTLFKRAISAKMQQESISEEMRVLYVATTRAKDRLFMTYAEKNLSSTLQKIAMRMDMTDPRLLSMDVSCPGEWILQAALKRTEAGELFARGGYTDCAEVKNSQWKIAVIDSCELPETICQTENLQASLPDSIFRSISDNLNFSYRWNDATQIPSKLTATQLKGRSLDDEIAEGTEILKAYQFRKPGKSAFSGKNYGNTIHSVLQYIRFTSCDSNEAILAELERLVKEELISPEQAASVDHKKILRFFSTPLGEKLRISKNVLREFKFSLLDSAAKYYSNTIDEQVLLQGVVDCALIEEDGIIVLDFKTDYVTEETISDVAESYRSQVLVYAEAMKRIYQLPVKAAVLYFFSLNRFIDII